MVAQHLQSLRKVAGPCVAPIHNELDRPFSDLPIVLRSDCLQSAQILGVQGPSPVVAGEQLHRDEVPDRCDGQHPESRTARWWHNGTETADRPKYPMLSLVADPPAPLLLGRPRQRR